MDIFGIMAATFIAVTSVIFLLQSRLSLTEVTARNIIVCCLGCWFLLITVRLLTNSIWIVALTSMICAVILCWHFGRAKIISSLYFGAIWGTLHFISGGAGIICKNLLPDLEKTHMLFAEIIVLYALTVFICTFSKKWNYGKSPLLTLVPVWLVLVLLCEEILRRRNDIGMPILVFFTYGWVFYSGVQLILVLRKLEVTRLEYLEAQQKSRHYVLQEEYYEILRNKQYETRALWHDLSKYLRAAQVEIMDSSALKQLESMLQSATQIVDVGNNVLNVILNEYDQMARASGTELRMKVQILPELPVSPADLYILIGNTMDNALTACKDLPQGQRIIQLTLRTYNGVLYYKLVNPCVNHTQKAVTDPLHGYGLDNVRLCVRKYRGDVETVKEDGFFVFSAHLNFE